MKSIVIPVFNKHFMTWECVEAVKRWTDGYELILIDNGSMPPLDVDETINSIRNEENLGFPIAVNQGIRAAQGETIVLLNNDVFVTPGWDVLLEDWLSAYDIIGPLTNYAAGLQREAIPHYGDQDELNRVAYEWARTHAGQSVEVNWVIGFCMAFKKSLWEELGPFDETLWPCCGEEIDFCLRARAAGKRIGIAADVYVHHEGSQTFEIMQEAGLIDYAAICQRDTKHLEKKWGKFWDRQLAGERKAA